MKMGPDGYSSRCDIWSLGITAIELAEMMPPMFDLHPMRALYLIPKNNPPKLAEKKKWSKDFHDWLKVALTKNALKRPAAHELMKHAWGLHFVKKAPTALAQLVRRCHGVATPEKKDEWMVDEVQNTGKVEGGLRRVESKKERKSAAGSGNDIGFSAVGGPADAGGGGDGGSQWGKSPVYVRPDGGGPQASENYPLKISPPHTRSGADSAGEQSFVLSNVFAGCPLQVNCAASWNCTPPGQEPCLYIIVGAESGLYILETSGDKRELVQVSKRICKWLHVMDDEGMMISVSGVGLVCVHDLNSLLVGPTEHIKFKTTKLIEGAKGGRCAVQQTPDTGFTCDMSHVAEKCYWRLLFTN